jgi:hypothetical protein
MEAVCPSETVTNLYRPTRRYNLEDIFLQTNNYSYYYEIPCLIKHQTVHYFVNNSPPFIRLMGQLNPMYNIVPCLFEDPF